MTKREEKKEEVKPEVEVVVEPIASESERTKLWKKYVENYKIANPVKGARKEANGEFKTPPPSFKGILVNSKGRQIIT